MKSAIFARPNLKALLLGAILIAVVQNFIANGHSQATPLHPKAPDKLDKASDRTVEQLCAQAEEAPDSHFYMDLSHWYEKRGEMKKALIYLRKAQILAQIEEANE